MRFLYLLENIRVPVLNEFMLAVTMLGEETAFLLIALILFWCVDKYIGYYTLSVGFVGTLTNQFLKLAFRIPRPWVLDPNFTILEQAREAASGYSFPSGHTQSAMGTFGSIACITKNKTIRAISIAVAVLVPISRMYIGVHTPLDVVVSIAIALLLIFVLKPLILDNEHKCMSVVFVAMLLLAIGYLGYVEFYPFPPDIDSHNYESGVQNAYTLFGCLVGMLVVYWFDEKWLHFQTKAVWWSQILKVILGLALVLAIKSGTKMPLNMLFGEHIGRSVRYCLVVLFAGILWPITFRWFSKLGKKE